MQHELVLVTFQENISKIIQKQLHAVFPDTFTIRGILLNELHPNDLVGQSVLVFSNGIHDTVLRMRHDSTTVIKGKRTLNMFALGNLIAQNPPKRILVVNDTQESTQEVIEELTNYDLGHIYSAYSPDQSHSEAVDFVVTPSEAALVPPQYSRVIDLGLRMMCIETVLSIADHFSLTQPRGKIITNFKASLAQMTNAETGPKTSRYITGWLGSPSMEQEAIGVQDIVAHSNAMRQMLNHATRLAVQDTPLHVSGNIGSGERVIARLLHNLSGQRSGSFNVLHCSSRTPDALERELFGWEEDDHIYPGILEQNDGGSVCIEDVDVIPLDQQKRLIQALAENSLIRTDGKMVVTHNARIITTSNGDLITLHQQGKLIDELFLMLSRNCCQIPPLAQRKEDIKPLINKFLAEHYSHQQYEIAPDLLIFFQNRHWKGDVQELFNVISPMASLGDTLLTKSQLPYYLLAEVSAPDETKSVDLATITSRIEEQGFLTESLDILRVYRDGKRKNKSYGRQKALDILASRDIDLTQQQLRLRLERLTSLGLIKARKGRAGSTITTAGEFFLDHCERV